jgi:hypothetical protein
MSILSLCRCPCFFCCGLLAAACLFLAGCARPSTGKEEKPVNRNVTRENLDRIKTDMTFKEVHDLLGASELVSLNENVKRSNGQVSGHSIEVRRWRDGDSWIVVTFDFGKVTQAEGANLREETQELRAALVGKWSETTDPALSKSAETYMFLASGELQARLSQRDKGDRVWIIAGGTWKLEGKILSFKFTVIDPASVKLKDSTAEIVRLDKEKLVLRREGKEVSLFRVT